MCVIDVCFTLIYTISQVLIHSCLRPQVGRSCLSDVFQLWSSLLTAGGSNGRCDEADQCGAAMPSDHTLSMLRVKLENGLVDRRTGWCDLPDVTNWSTCMLLWWWQTISRNGFDIILPTCIDAYSPRIQHVQTPVTIRGRVARCAFSWSWGLLEPFAIRWLAALRACCCVVEQLERHWVVCCQPAMPCWRICILRRRWPKLRAGHIPHWKNHEVITGYLLIIYVNN